MTHIQRHAENITAIKGHVAGLMHDIAADTQAGGDKDKAKEPLDKYTGWYFTLEYLEFLFKLAEEEDRIANLNKGPTNE